MPKIILDNASVIKDTVDKAKPEDLEDTKKGGSEPAEFVVTEAQVQAVLLKLKDIEKANGYCGIAQATCVPADVVREIEAARAERKAKDGIKLGEVEKLEG